MELEESTDVTLSFYLASRGFVTGSFVTMTISDLVSGDKTKHCGDGSVFAMQHNLKHGDVICAATTLDLDLSKSQQLRLIQRIRALCDGFSEADVLLNNVMHTWGEEPIPVVTTPQPPPPVVFKGPSEELILWVRLQLHMKHYYDRNPTKTPFPKGFFETLKDREIVGKHAQVLTLASILLSPIVCWHLSPYFSKPGCIFEFNINEVVQFFSRVVHGYDSLHSEAYNFLQDDRDTFLTHVIDGLGKNTSKKLRDWISTLFEPYASHFDYLKVTATIPDPSIPSSERCFTLRREGPSSTWRSSDGSLTIYWQNNWSVRYGEVVLAEKVVLKHLCIPFLSCLQKGGGWFNTNKGTFSVVLGSSEDYRTSVTSDAPDASCATAGTASLHRNAKRASNDSNASNAIVEQRDQKLELRKTPSQDKRPKVTVPESVFSLLTPFMSWDSVLNVFHSLESVSVTVMQDLLERCLWLWAARNDEFKEMEEFYTSAIQSLHDYAGKDSGADPRWATFFEKFGCYETPRLWTLKERMVLMVACSWPVYYWDNIDQKKSAESASLRIRGMALLHPRFTQFLRSRMLEFGFINDEDFPPHFSNCSAVTICSNVCARSLSKLGWNNLFQIDLSVSPTFFRLTGCSKELNADGLYAATSVMFNGTRVYAIVNSAMHSNLKKEFAKSYGKYAEGLYAEPLLNQPTVILVTVFEGDIQPRLESVKFAFALLLQEFILMRDDESYRRFFTVSCNDGAFIYLPMSSPVLEAVSFTFDVSKKTSSKKTPEPLFFTFGHCPVPVPDPLQPMLKKKQLQHLTDQEIHCDGNPNGSSFLASQDVPVCGQSKTVVSMHGLAPRNKRAIGAGDLTTPNHSTISRSALYAVFHDTFIGVRIGRQLVYLKIHDGCCFLFSFWFKHFGVGTDKWHFRPHSYFHSKDIRHFPVESPEHFFVFLAAIKLGSMCNEPLSLAAFEIMILHSLNTYTGTDAEPLPSELFSDLDPVAVKDRIGEFYSLLTDTVVDTPSTQPLKAPSKKGRVSESTKPAPTDVAAAQISRSQVTISSGRGTCMCVLHGIIPHPHVTRHI